MKTLAAILTGLLPWLPGVALAADGSGDLSDLATWYATASDDDTFTMDSGQLSLTAALVLDRDVSVNIVGQGIGVTEIVDDRSSNHSFVTLDNSDPTVHIKIADFTFEPGTNTSKHNGLILCRGRGTFEVARVEDNSVYGEFFRSGDGDMTGVIHNCIVRLSSHGNDTKFNFFHSQWGIDTYGNDAEWGDGSWAVGPTPGTGDAIFIEDNEFICTNGGVEAYCDFYGGCRTVWRYNLWVDVNGASHGTGDGAGNERGPVMTEIYNNEWRYTSSDSQVAFNIRGGWVLSANNLYNDLAANVSKTLSFKQYLYHSHHGKFGASDGENEWDENDTSDDGTGFDGGASGDGIFEAGTTGSGTTDNTVVSDTDYSWPVDHWAGYVVRVDTGNTFDYPDGYIASVINSNTSDTLTVEPASNTTPGLPPGSQPNSSATSLDFNDNGGSPDTITRSSGSFLTDGFIDGYGLPVTVASAETSANNGTYITTSVTATTITLDAGESLTTDTGDVSATIKMVKGGGTAKAFEVGQSFEIRKVDLSLDQVGAGASDLVTRAATGGVYNTPPVANTKISDGTNGFVDGSRIRVPVNQEIMPAYVFNNTYNGASGASGEAAIREDYHWFEEDASFDGSGGIGVGAGTAGRPASPSLVNVGWYDTTATQLTIWDGDSWELFWEPFTYPHPLRSDGAGGGGGGGSTATSASAGSVTVGP